MQTSTLHITDTRIAASLLALGFPGEPQATVHTQSGVTTYEVLFSGPSTRFPALDARKIVQHWRSSRFLQPFMDGAPAEPMHMLAVMMRAQESYDAFLKMQKEGCEMYLSPVLFKRNQTDKEEIVAYEYKMGKCSMNADNVIREPLDDLSLCAALGPLGIAAFRIFGSPPLCKYYMAACGRILTDSSGIVVNYLTSDLIRMAASGERRLALEDINPSHPLVIGYDALHARQILKKEISRAEHARLLVTGNDATAKQALIAVNHKGHVGEAVCRHLKAPSSALNI